MSHWIDTGLLLVIVILEVLDLFAVLQTGRQESETRGVLLQLLVKLSEREIGGNSEHVQVNIRK